MPPRRTAAGKWLLVRRRMRRPTRQRLGLIRTVAVSLYLLTLAPLELTSVPFGLGLTGVQSLLGGMVVALRPRTSRGPALGRTATAAALSKRRCCGGQKNPNVSLMRQG